MKLKLGIILAVFTIGNFSLAGTINKDSLFFDKDNYTCVVLSGQDKDVWFSTFDVTRTKLKHTVIDILVHKKNRASKKYQAAAKEISETIVEGANGPSGAELRFNLINPDLYKNLTLTAKKTSYLTEITYLAESKTDSALDSTGTCYNVDNLNTIIGSGVF